MKLVFIIVAIVAVSIGMAILLVVLLGTRLPKQHTATRSVLLHQPPQKVYAVARDFASMPKWRSDVRAVTVFDGPDGHVHFREEGKHGTVNYALVEDVPDRRMITRITDTDLGYAGQWTYRFEADGSNTRVTITEDGEVSNVIFRFLSKYAFGHTATIDAYLVALGKQFGESATLE